MLTPPILQAMTNQPPLDRKMLRVAVNSAASDLRDQADRDYVTARHVYGLGYADQFMWQAEQALEKYLKAILLFASDLPHEGGSAKVNGIRGFSHDLSKLLPHVLAIRPWLPEISDETRKFVLHAHDMGMNRYSDREVYRFGNELPNLDRAVWEIRRWCMAVQRTPPARASVTPARFLEVQREYVLRMAPGPSQHINGLLEDVITRRRSGIWRHARASLVRWNQWYFGKRPSPYLAPRWGSSSVPVHKRSWAKHAEIAKLLKEIGVA